MPCYHESDKVTGKVGGFVWRIYLACGKMDRMELRVSKVEVAADTFA